MTHIPFTTIKSLWNIPIWIYLLVVKGTTGTISTYFNVPRQDVQQVAATAFAFAAILKNGQARGVHGAVF